MSTFQIINSNDNTVIETGTDGQALFDKLPALNRPGGPVYFVKQLANGAPEQVLTASIVAAMAGAPEPTVTVGVAPKPNASPGEKLDTLWTVVDGRRTRTTLVGVYTFVLGRIFSEVSGTIRDLGAAKTYGDAERLIALFEKPLTFEETAIAAKVTLAPVPRVEIAGKTVDAVAKIEIDAEERAARSAGFAREAGWFGNGTDMMAEGVAKYHEYARGFEAMGDAEQVLTERINQVIGERRRDVVVDGADIRRIRLSDDGLLSFGNGRKARLTEQAFKQLASRYTGACLDLDWARKMSPGIRGGAVSEGLASLSASQLGSMFRIREQDGEPTIYALVGPEYPGRKTDADAILREILRQVAGTGAKAEVTIDPNTTRLQGRIVWSKSMARDPKVGDTFQASIVFSSRDDAQAFLRIWGALLRILCINCTVAEEAAGMEKLRHSKSATTVKVGAMIDGARAKIEPMLNLWGKTSKLDPVIDLGNDKSLSDILSKPADIFAELWSNGDLLAKCLKDIGIARDLAAEVCLRGWNTNAANGDQSGSWNDLVNAVSKAAQDRELDRFQRFGMERAAGQLVYVGARLAAAA